MRYHLLTAIGVSLLASVQVLAQGRPADTTNGRPIQDPLPKPAQLDPGLSDRQPGWIDESAITAGSQLEPAKAPPAVEDQSSPSAPEIRSYVARLTDAALSPDGIHKALAMLSDEDRVRLQKDLHPEDVQAYDELVQRLRTQWKVRYGEDFDLAKQTAIMSEYLVLRGAQANDPITVGATVNANDRHTGSAANNPPAASAAHATQEHIATMVVPLNPQTQQPTMLLQFRDAPSGKVSNWRLSTPQSLTGTRLQENLKARAKTLLDGQATWPANPREAYRLITYHVLACLADQPLDRPRQESDHPQPVVNPNNPSLES